MLQCCHYIEQCRHYMRQCHHSVRRFCHYLAAMPSLSAAMSWSTTPIYQVSLKKRVLLIAALKQEKVLTEVEKELWEGGGWRDQIKVSIQFSVDQGSLKGTVTKDFQSLSLG